jgi:hypothetical protein
VVLLVILTVFAKVEPMHRVTGALVPQNRALAGAALILAAVAAAGFAPRLTGARLRPAGVSVLLALAAAAELFWQGRRLYRFGSPAEFYPPSPLVRFLEKAPRPFRILGEGPVLYPSTHVFAGLEDVRIHDPVERREYVEFLDAACGYDPAAFFKHVANVDCRALDFLNVRYLVTGPGRAAPGARWRRVYAGADGTVFENADVLPRVFAPQRLRPVPDGARLRDLVAAMSWPTEAFLDPDPRRVPPPGDAGMNGPVRVSEYEEATNSAAFRSEAPEGGAVVVASLVQDGGWTARDESGSLPTGRANGPFLAIGIPAGPHRIRLSYIPPGARDGAIVSLATLGLVLAAAALRRRARSPTPSPNL